MQKQDPIDVEKAVCLHLARRLQALSGTGSRLFAQQLELEDRLDGVATDSEKEKLRERIRELQEERREVTRQERIVSAELGTALEHAQRLQASLAQDRNRE